MNGLETVVEEIPLKAISVVANARTDMDVKKLEELKATISTGGIRTPLLLAPLKASGVALPGKYRVVCGHRRFTAASDLELATVPAIVRDLSDDEIEVEQLVENDAREDLTALDRAAQYKKLQERGLDAAAIAKRVGRARSTVELTLKLADLVEPGRQALRKGWLPQGAAEELALVPASLQVKALKDLEQLHQDGELTRESARTVLRAKYFLDLGEVLFDIRDAHLVPSAGACVPSCTKRTGAQADLFGKKDGPDCCMDLPCLRIKEGAWLRDREKAGQRVLSGAEVKKVFEYSEERPDASTGFVLADEKDYRTSSSKTYRSELGKDAANKVVLARSPTGALVELVDVKDLPKPSAAAKASPVVKHEKSAAEKRRELEQKAAREAVGRALTDVGQHLAGGKLGQYDADVAELVFRALLRESHKDTKVALAKLMLLEPGKGYDGADTALLAHYEATEKKRKTPGWDFVVLLALAPALLTNPIYPDQGAINDLKKFLKLLGGPDLTKIRADVERDLRNAEKTKAAKKVAKKKTSKRESQLSHGLDPVFDSEREEQEEIRAGAHLVMHAGGSDFRLTHAGVKALGGYEQGYRIVPGSPLVDELVKAEAAGKGKLNLKLQRLHHNKGLEARGLGDAMPSAFAKTTGPTDPIQWLPKKHPKIVAVGLGRDGRRYTVEREKRDSKNVGFFFRGGPDGNFVAPGAGWGSVVETEEKAKSMAEEHETRAAAKKAASK